MVILTEREREIISKKIKGTSLTQNESNILSKYIRPKLREIRKINIDYISNKIEYNQKARAIENKIKKIALKNVEKVESIVLYGSAIQTNYKNYKDIDVLIITKEKLWSSTGEKYQIILDLINRAKKEKLDLDIQITDKKSFYNQYPHNPSLIYQLEDSKIVYGKLKLSSHLELSKLDLRMKLDWSDIDDEESNGENIYQSLRNILLVRLLLNKIVDNAILNESVKKELGERLMKRLKDNLASKLEKRLVLMYIRKLSKETDRKILEAKWEKIVL
ncbi:MAG: nucleotidyltransferase domain-containing protein [Nanoarchaeota archaeon]